MASLRRSLTFGTSLLALVAVVWGVQRAMRSPMFVLQVVEIADQPENAPVDAQAISDLAALPVGRINLFELDLAPVEERVLSNAWIREVRLQKHFPQTLSISVSYREPQALMQGESGALSYVDVDGRIFGQVNLLHQPDLPILSASTAGHVGEALQLLRAWSVSEVSKVAQVATLQWDHEHGFRALVTYPMEQAAGAGAGAPSFGRTWVDLGQDLDAEAQFKRLSRVFGYLSANRVHARQVWADAGKKVVVRTVRGS